MGIDIYMRWSGQTKAEKEAQYTGFSIEHGHVGYLREAYHGGPYCTHKLMPEAFNEDNKCEAEIPAATLRGRLPEAISTCKERSQKVYQETIGDDAPEIKSLVAFVELAERKEKETGKPVTIHASY